MQQMTKTTGNNEWYTPAEYVEAARAVLGGIDLDPASCEQAQRIVKADTYYTIENDGRLHDWRGRVFMNPPYARKLVDQFVAKLIESYQAGSVKSYIALVNDCMDTQWAHDLLRHSTAVCFVRGRIKFHTKYGVKGNAAPRGQAFYFGGDLSDHLRRAENARRFRKYFSEFGTVIML